MIRITQRGNFNRTEKFLKGAKKLRPRDVLERYGRAGADALSANTPVESGKTASSWSYEIEQGNGTYKVYWTNSNINKGVSIAIILQYGHGTGNGGYVQGRDYINPALRPIFDKMANELWKEVTSL